MKRSYIETMFRHKMVCLGPVVLAAGLGSFLAHDRPAQYIASASIFADAPLPDPSTVGTTGTAGGTAPPSAGQQALMSNFLATRSFLLTVARKSDVPLATNAPPRQLEKSLAALGASVKTSTPGPNVMVVTVTRPSAAEATRVASSVVDVFLSLEKDTIARRGESQLSDAMGQVDAAAKAAAEAQKAATSYEQAHPGAQPGTDRQLAKLRGTASTAQEQYTNTQKALGDTIANIPVVDSSNLFVVDRADSAIPKGRTKAMILGGGGGLLGGVAISLVAMMLLVRRDTTIRTAADVEDDLSLPVVGRIGLLNHRRRSAADQSATAVPAPSSALVGAALGGRRAAETDRHQPTLFADGMDALPAEVIGACRSALRATLDGASCIGVTGVAHGDGSTTVAIGTALAKREDYEQPVVLVDLNFWRPAVATTLKVDDGPGVADVLRGAADLADAVVWADSYLGVMTAGRVDDPQRLLAEFRRSSVIADLVARGYFVVADLPLLPPAGRGDRLGEMFWSLLIVVGCGTATMDAVREGAASVSTPVSVILNRCSSPVPRWLRHTEAG